MFRKIGYSFLVAFAAAIFTASAAAQVGQISGMIEFKAADGTVTPFEGATVEVFRTDNKSSGVSETTDKKGQFRFAGLTTSGTYVISISAPGASPQIYPAVKPPLENVKFVLEPGDGRKLTAEEVRTAAAQAADANTEEGKKAQAEFEAKKKEIEAKNAKILKETEIIQASLKDGNTAFEAKNWDGAIAKYDEGINANPTFAGSAPVLMNNKGAALRERAVATYNQNVKNADVTAKVAAFAKVKEDLGNAADTYHKSWTLLQNASATDISDPKVKEAQTGVAVRGAVDSFRLMSQTEQVDETKIDAAKAMIPVYIGMETDQAKKEQAKLILGDLYRVVGDADNAITEYRKVIEASPENLDALAGLGLSLVNAGYINDNKDQLQEGANYLQKFASAAPNTHKYKDDALGLIESLKTEQKIAPQKVSTPARRRN